MATGLDMVPLCTVREAKGLVWDLGGVSRWAEADSVDKGAQSVVGGALRR